MEREMNKVEIEKASALIGKAFIVPLDGIEMLSRVGIKFGRWQRVRIRFYLLIDKIKAAQSVILKSVKSIIKINE